MPNLTALSLNGDRITANGVRVLLPFVSAVNTLRVLELADNPIGGEGGTLLGELSPRLDSIMLNNTEMTSKGLLGLGQPGSEILQHRCC